MSLLRRNGTSAESHQTDCGRAHFAILGLSLDLHDRAWADRLIDHHQIAPRRRVRDSDAKADRGEYPGLAALAVWMRLNDTFGGLFTLGRFTESHVLALAVSETGAGREAESSAYTSSVSRITRSSANSSTAIRRPAAPNRARSAPSSSRLASARASSRGLRGDTRIPFSPSRTISRHPAMSEATRAPPQTAPSIKTIGIHSP